MRIKAKFHFTGRPDPHGPNGVSRRPGPQKSPFGSGRARVVEFSYDDVYIDNFSYRSGRRPRQLRHCTSPAVTPSAEACLVRGRTTPACVGARYKRPDDDRTPDNTGRRPTPRGHFQLLRGTQRFNLAD